MEMKELIQKHAELKKEVYYDHYTSYGNTTFHDKIFGIKVLITKSLEFGDFLITGN